MCVQHKHHVSRLLHNLGRKLGAELQRERAGHQRGESAFGDAQHVLPHIRLHRRLLCAQQM